MRSSPILAAAVAGDLDRDGYLDLVTSHPNPGTVSVLAGRGDGTFGQASPVATARFPQGLADGDIDRDGHVDLAVSSYDPTVTILLGDGKGAFASRSDVLDAPSGAVRLTDLDRDGSLDLVTVHFGTVSTRLGAETGAFGPPRDFTVGTGARALASATSTKTGGPTSSPRTPGPGARTHTAASCPTRAHPCCSERETARSRAASTSGQACCRTRCRSRT